MLPASQPGEVNQALVAAWTAEEFPFLAADRSWERATVVVAGTPDLDHNPVTQVVLARQATQPAGGQPQTAP